MVRNRQFSILMCIAIVLMVIGHIGGIRWFNLSDWFPMYGYHMALFVFISGYFYKPITIDHYPQYVWRKTKRLVLPLWGWNIVYAIITYWVSKKGLVDYLPPTDHIFTFHNLFIEPFIGGHQYILNLATWFVGCLFLVEIVYGALSCYMDNRSTNGVQLLFYLSLGLIGTCLSKMDFGASYWICLRKVLYFLFFFHLGRFYRSDWQAMEQKWKPYWLMIIAISLVVLQAVIYNILGCTAMGPAFANFRGWIIMPFIVGIIGIYFWVCLSQLIEKWISANAWEEFISTHTWEIMTHHLFVLFIMNTLLIYIAPERINMVGYRSSIFYYDALPEIVYLTIILAITLGLGYIKNYLIKAIQHIHKVNGRKDA